MKKWLVALSVTTYIIYIAVSAWGILNFGQEIKDIMNDPDHWRRDAKTRWK